MQIDPELALGSEAMDNTIRAYAKANFEVQEKPTVGVDSEENRRQLAKVSDPQDISDFIDTSKLEPAMVEELTRLLDELVPLSFGVEPVVKKFADETEAESYVGTTLNGYKIISTKNISKPGKRPLYVLNYLSETGTDNAKTYKEYTMSTRYGEAQKAFNNLAKANEHIAGENIRITFPDKTDRSRKLTGGKSLFSPTQAIDFQSFYDDFGTELGVSEQDVVDNGGEQKTKYLIDQVLAKNVGKTVLTFNGPVEISDSASVNDILDDYRATPVDDLLLSLIVGNVAFDEKGNHVNVAGGQGLREPLHMETVNFLGGSSDRNNPTALDEQSRSDLSKLLSSSFMGMARTKVVLAIPEEGTIDEPVLDHPKTIGEGLGRLGSTGKEYFDRLIELFKATPSLQNIPIYYYANGIEGERNVARAKLSKDGQASIHTAIDFSDLRDENKLAIFLHEAIHASTLGAIKRAKAKKATEAEKDFYKTLTAIQKRFNAYVQFSLKQKLADVYQKTEGKFDTYEFISNLSNKKFFNIASSKGIGKLLSDILNAFLKLFGVKPETNFYDATFTALEDFLISTTSATTMVDLPIQEEDLTPKYNDLLSTYINNVKSTIKTYTNRRSIAEENEDEDEVERYDNVIKDIISSEAGVYDFNTNTVNKEFEALDILNRIELLNQVSGKYLNDDGATVKSAYITPEQDSITASPGTILTTAGVREFVKNRFPTLGGRPEFLMRSIIQAQVNDPNSNIVDRIIESPGIDSANVDERAKFLNTFLFDIFTWADREKLRRELDVMSDAELVIRLVSEFGRTAVVADILNVATQLRDARTSLDFFIADTMDKNIDRYIQAKQFILDELYANATVTGSMIKTKDEVLKDISTKLSEKSSNPNELILGLENKLSKLEDMLTLLASKIDRLTESEKLQYSQLISVEIPATENKLFALRALTKVNTRTGRVLFFDILSDIYPKNKFTSESDLELIVDDTEYVINDRGEREVKEAANINEYIKNYDKSYELTLSESVKDFLSYIPAPSGGFLNAGLAYIKTLQLVISLDWKTEKKGLQHILSQLSALQGESALSDLDIAVIKNLRNLIGNALATQDTNTLFPLAKNINIVSTIHSSGRVVYSAVYTSGTSAVTKLTYDEAKAANDVLVSEQTAKTSDLYNWLNIKYQKENNQVLPISLFNTLFRRAEAVNAVREVHNVMASMKETELYNTNRSNKKGLRFANQRSKAAGGSFGLKDDMIDNLRELQDRDKLRTFKEDFIARNSEAWKAINSGKTDDKIDAIIVFLRSVGMAIPEKGASKESKWPLTITDETVSKLVEDVKGFMDRTKLVISADKETTTDADVAESGESVSKKKQEFKTMADWLDHVDGYLTRFSELVAKSIDTVRNPSVKDAKGNKFYKIHEDTWGDDTFDALIARRPSAEFRGTRGTSRFFTLPEHLTADYYDDNIFVNGLNYIAAKGEHEASKNLDNGSVTPLMRENVFFFYHREFAQGFLDGARQYNGNEYWSYLYPPSDKPKYPMLRMKILSDSKESPEVKQAVTSALQQILSRRGASFKIANFNKSLANDEFRNFEIGQKALDVLQTTLTKDNINLVASEIMRQLSIEAGDKLRELLSDDVQLSFDERSYDIFRSLESKIEKPFKYEDKQRFVSKRSKDGERQYVVEYDEIFPIFDLFFKNHYVNNYFANQLTSGDYTFYKGTTDLVKRTTGILAPGIRPLVDDAIGMDQHYNMLVLDDTSIPIENTRERLRNLLFGKEMSANDTAEFERLMKFFESSYDMSDAQGFMIPRRFNQLTRGLGRAWGIGNVMKPVYFDVKKVETTKEDGTKYTTASPRYIKYSVVNLEDSLVAKFPILGRLRERMEALDADELTFSSAVKEGKPLTNPLSFKTLHDAKTTDIEAIKQWEVSPIMKLDNINYRLQHNPASDPNKSVAIYSQLMYFLNVTQHSQPAAKIAYQLVADLIEMGRERFDELIGDGNSAKLRKFLASKFDGPGAERALDLINSGISLSHPLLEKKAIVALSSALEKETVKIKFPGGKLVLQTSEGVRMFNDDAIDDDTYQAGQELSYKKGTFGDQELLYAEVIIPKALLTDEQVAALDRGDQLFLYGDGIGFRIPSTELHSAVPFRVVGTYSNLDTNVIIAPKELVPIHGSDFDVDALFVITRENYDANNNSFSSASTVRELFSRYSSIYEALTDAIVTIPDQRDVLNKSLDVVNRRLRSILSALDEQSLDQNEVEASYRKFIATPTPIGDVTMPMMNQPSFRDKNARRLFATKYGYRYTKDGWMRKRDSAIESLTVMYEELSKLFTANPELVLRHEGLKNLASNLESQKETISTLADTNLLGEQGTPIGYTKAGGLYDIDDDFLTKEDGIDAHIAQLQKLKQDIPADFAHVFSPKISADIKRLKSIKEKYIRNYITETMLRTITSKQNNLRMVYPISFKPLTSVFEAIAVQLGLTIETINEDLSINVKPDVDKLTGKATDLSNISHKQIAYSLLTDGAVLVGAFANAVKEFAYMSRAGDDGSVSNYLNEYATVKNKVDALETAEFLSNDSKEELDRLKKSLKEQFSKDKLKEITATAKNKEVVAQIHPMYHYSMKLKGKLQTFKGLRTSDVFDGYKVTEVFDTLVNAAIDNLKLGYLPKARINTNTGSVIVGMISLGVPLETAIKMLYQPIFDPLVTGKVNRVDRDFISKIEQEYKKELANIDSVLSDTELDAGLDYRKQVHNPTYIPLAKVKDRGDVFAAQLKAFMIFKKAYKIGEDMRNLADFMNIIRQLDVFIEDIDAVETNFASKIGSIDENNLLVTRSDFSLVIPYLFINNPHLDQAYKTIKYLRTTIGKTFKVHSEEIVKLTKEAYKGLELATDEEYDTTEANLASMRRELISYLLSKIVWDELKDVKPATVTIKGTNGLKQTLSIGRTYSEGVATDLRKLKNFANRNGHNNTFLKIVSIAKDEFGVNRISFRGGVNLNSADIEQIMKGFSNLNKYGINEKGEVEMVNPPTPNYITPFQKSLMYYAIINYGLQFSTANYSNYIPANMFTGLDSRLNSELDKLMYDVKYNPAIAKQVANHFKLSYVVENADRLPYLSREDSVATTEFYSQSLDRTVNVYNGVDVVQDIPIYFDRKVHAKAKLGDWIKTAYDNRVEVYKKVHSTDLFDYYQRVGKTSEVFHSPVPDTDYYGNPYEGYNAVEFYTPYEFTLTYSDVKEITKGENKAKVGDKLTLTSFVYPDAGDGKTYLSPGDEFWIVPTYNIDRTMRIRVKLLDNPKRADSIYRGHIYKVEIVEPTILTAKAPPGKKIEDAIIEQIENKCKK